MKDISARMRSILETTAVETEAGSASAGIDVHALAQHIALSIEALAPDADPKDVMQALKLLVVGKQKSVLLTTLKRFTSAKAAKTLRTVKKELA